MPTHRVNPHLRRVPALHSQCEWERAWWCRQFLERHGLLTRDEAKAVQERIEETYSDVYRPTKPVKRKTQQLELFRRKAR